MVMYRALLIRKLPNVKTGLKAFMQICISALFIVPLYVYTHDNVESPATVVLNALACICQLVKRLLIFAPRALKCIRVYATQRDNHLFP